MNQNSKQRNQNALEKDEKPVLISVSLLREQVYDLLRTRVLKGALPPGYRLVEDELAEYFGVSRTPIREAIRRLEIEGLVVASEGRGFEVAAIGQKETEDALEIRLLLEAYAARHAASHASPEQILELRNICKLEQEYIHSNPDKHLTELNQLNWKFHGIIVECAHNQILSNIIEMALLNKAYRLYALGDLHNTHLFADSHIRFVEAFEKRDADAAEAEAAYHINLMRKLLLTDQEITDIKPIIHPKDL